MTDLECFLDRRWLNVDADVAFERWSISMPVPRRLLIDLEPNDLLIVVNRAAGMLCGVAIVQSIKSNEIDSDLLRYPRHYTNVPVHMYDLRGNDVKYPFRSRTIFRLLSERQVLTAIEEELQHHEGGTRIVRDRFERGFRNLLISRVEGSPRLQNLWTRDFEFQGQEQWTNAEAILDEKEEYRFPEGFRERPASRKPTSHEDRETFLTADPAVASTEALVRFFQVHVMSPLAWLQRTSSVIDRLEFSFESGSLMLDRAAEPPAATVDREKRDVEDHDMRFRQHDEGGETIEEQPPEEKGLLDIETAMRRLESISSSREDITDAIEGWSRIHKDVP